MKRKEKIAPGPRGGFYLGLKMFGSGVKKQAMIETLRRAQAKNLSIEKARSFQDVLSPLDMKNSKLKDAAMKKQKIKRAGVANPKEVYEEIVEKWEKGNKNVQSAIEKLSVRATRFDKAKEADFVKAFETVSLSIDSFRVMLLRVFQLTFTDEEFEETCAIFDRHKNKSIDGNEFLVCFTLLGALAKSKRAEGIRKAEQMFKDKEKAVADERRARLLAKGEKKVDYEYSGEEKDSALTKYRAAAMKYDKAHPSSMGLSGFDEKFLSPTTFREIVKLTFGLVLDNKELGAIMDYVDPSRQGIVKSADFLKNFLRSGVEQRNEATLQQLKLSKEAERERLEHSEKLKADLEASKELAVDFSATDKEKANTMERLHEAAVKYDGSHPSARGLEGFATKLLKPGAFREMLKRTFNLIVDAKELGVLVNMFGDTSKKFIVSEKFLLYFKRVGIKGRQKIHSEQLERQRADNEARAKASRDKLEAQIKALETGFDPNNFKESDDKSMEKKMRAAALKFEKGGRGIPLESFNSKHMEPGVFRELAKRIFNMIFTLQELAACVKRFDNGQGKIDCALFMTAFGRMSFEEKNIAAAKRRELARAIETKLKDEGTNVRAENMKKLDENAIVKKFTDKDLESALAKLQKAAATLQAPSFDTKKMNPGLFKVMLKRTFNADLTPPEVTAVIQPYFDEKKNQVDVKPFILKFFSIHKEVKNTRRATMLQNNREMMLKQIEAAQAKADAHRLADLARLQFNSETRNGVTQKMRDASFSYACDSASFVKSLQLFKGPALTAHAFRDTFYRTFMIRFTMPEIGVIMDTLDSKLAEERMISGEKFLKAFFKLGRLQEKVLIGSMQESSVSPLDVLDEVANSEKMPPVESPNKSNDRKGDIKGKLASIKRDQDKPGFLSTFCGGRNPWKDRLESS